jgi:O-antigen/teichoic acid export membrane protein
MAADPATSSLGRMTRRLVEHIRTPVYREGYALVVSAALASALGFVYWVVAARAYSSEVVGLNSVAISTMVLISGIAQLNLAGALLRFVPVAGRATFRLVGWSYATSLAAAALIAPVFLVGVHAWLPKLEFLTADYRFALWFVAATMLWCVFSLQDSVLTGLRWAIWVPVDNTLFALAKLVLVVAFASAFPRMGIYASWTVGVVLSVVVINILLASRLIPAHVRKSSATLKLPSLGVIRRFIAADYVGGLSWSVALTVIPIAITQRLGASQNAYYALAWVMTMPLYLVSLNTSSSLVVSAVNERARLRDYSHRVFMQTARLVVPGACILAVGAPVFLRAFGGEYAHQGSLTLRLLALSAIPNMVCTLYLGVWRAEQRLSLLVWVRVIQFTVVVLASVALLGPEGIRGPAIAWLVVQAVVAGLLIAIWPGVLFGDDSRPPRSLRGIRVMRNAAADSGLLTLAQGLRKRPLRLRLERAAVTIPLVLAEVPEGIAGEAPRTWTAWELPRTVADKTVILVGPPGEPPRAAVKLAESPRAARSVVREAEVLRLLGRDPRLEGWRPLLPELLALGQVDGVSYVVESALRGVPASQSMTRGSAPGAHFTALADAIDGLHRQTGTEIVVGEEILSAWVEEPLEILRRPAARAWQLRALDRLRAELYEALLGRQVSAGWIHGDYVPGNVLLDPVSGAISGIVDWELAASPHLPAVDLMQLILAARVLSSGREFGEIVTLALEGDWSDQERAVLDPVREAFGGEPPLRALVLLTWLRHVASMLTKSGGYDEHWLWTKSNLEAVLAVLHDDHGPRPRSGSAAPRSTW